MADFHILDCTKIDGTVVDLINYILEMTDGADRKALIKILEDGHMVVYDEKNECYRMLRVDELI